MIKCDVCGKEFDPNVEGFLGIEEQFCGDYMEQKFLFVGEYDDSYTGGSVVFISTEESLSQFELNGLKVILDPHQNQLRKIRHLIPYNDEFSDGIEPERFWELVNSGEFTDDFKNTLKTWLSPDTKIHYGRYPGYEDGRIRIDWFPENEHGIYIVYKVLSNSESDEIEIVSDTYYCA